MRHLTKFLQDEEGASAVEYGLLVGLIAAAIVVAVTSLGLSVSTIYTYVSTVIPTT